jgi:dipeptidase E
VTRPRRIVALGGGGFAMEPDNPRLDDHILAATGADRPRILLIATASGDSDSFVARFYDAFARKAVASHLPLFRRRDADLRERILEQDAIFVGGGNTANLLAVWRVHGVDAHLREAYDRGVVLSGISAGALCWFEGGITDSFGAFAPLTGGLGLIAGAWRVRRDPETGAAVEQAHPARLLD